MHKIRKQRLNAQQKKELVEDLRWRFIHDVFHSKAQVGDLLPSVKDITERYNVTLAVARDMYAQMKLEGYVEPSSRTGVFLKVEFTDLINEVPSPKKLNLGVVAFIQHENPRHIHTRAHLALEAFERKSAQNEGRTKLFNLAPGHNVGIDLLEEIKRESPDGILFIPPYPEDIDENIRKLLMLDIPVVATTKTSRTHTVLFDHKQSALELTRYLLDQNYEHIGLVQKEVDSYWAQERLRGIRQAFAERERQIEENLICLVKNEPLSEDYPLEQEQFLKKLTLEKRTALIFSGDLYAVEFHNAAVKRGWDIPTQVGIASIGDHWLARSFNFTTIQLSEYDLGLTAYDLLAQIIASPSSGIIERKLACPLIIRETTS